MALRSTGSTCQRCGTSLDPTWDRCPYCPEPLAAPVAMKWLVVTGGANEGEVIALERRLRLGNGAGNHVRLDDPYLSTQHAEVSPEGDQVKLRDLGSTNGIFLNGQRIDHANLRDRDHIQMGSTPMVFRSWRSDLPHTSARHGHDAVAGWVLFLAGERALETVVLPPPVAIFGTARNCDVQFEDVFASSHHAQIVRSSRGFVLEDLASTNGTRVNGVRSTNVPLADGDLIQVGRTQLMFFAE